MSQEQVLKKFVVDWEQSHMFGYYNMFIYGFLGWVTLVFHLVESKWVTVSVSEIWYLAYMVCSLVAFLYTLIWLCVGLPFEFADPYIGTWYCGWLPFMYLWISLMVLLLSFLLLNTSSDGDEKEQSLNLKFSGAEGSKHKERESNYGSMDKFKYGQDEDAESMDDRDVSKDDD